MAWPSDKSSEKERKPSILECGQETQTRKEVSVNKFPIFCSLRSLCLMKKRLPKKQSQSSRGSWKLAHHAWATLHGKWKGKRRSELQIYPAFSWKDKTSRKPVAFISGKCFFRDRNPTEMPRPQAKKTDYIGTLILPLPIFSVLPPWRYLLSNPA